nr:MAG TPA: hypothetical protein [Caudoviricetes sp.]
MCVVALYQLSYVRMCYLHGQQMTKIRQSQEKAKPPRGCALPTKLCPHVLPSRATDDKDTPISGKSQAPACPTGFPTIIGCRRAHNSRWPHTAAKRWAWPA